MYVYVYVYLVGTVTTILFAMGQRERVVVVAWLDSFGGRHFMMTRWSFPDRRSNDETQKPIPNNKHDDVHSGLVAVLHWRYLPSGLHTGRGTKMWMCSSNQIIFSSLFGRCLVDCYKYNIYIQIQYIIYIYKYIRYTNIIYIHT
jgi:hypothetical protein